MRARISIAVFSTVAAMLSAPFPVRAEPAPPPERDLAISVTGPGAPASIDAGEREELLGGGWESSDRVVTTAGDATGFHVLVADAEDGYRWRTAASLSEPGFDTDAWIGNLCVTASGDRAVVVYAPRTFTNKGELSERGGFTAIVDLNDGPVRKLPLQTTLAYFNPGCGPSETAVLTQEGTEDHGVTRLFRLDATSGKLAQPIKVPGQLTSAVPVADGIVAADSGAVVRVRPDGRRTVVASAKGVPYRLAPDADGGLVFAQLEGEETAAVRRVDLKRDNAVTTLATGGITELSVRAARGGRVFVTGAGTAKIAATPDSVTLADVPHALSLSGDVAVTEVLRTHARDPRVPPADPSAPQEVDITATALATGRSFTLSVTPEAGAGEGARPSPALGVRTAAAGDPNDPADGDQRFCSVARNDPRNQAMQPKPRQVEWAVNQAVAGALTVQRPANWKNLDMPAYTPQGLFPHRSLDGGGAIPAQIMMGVAVQESNTWQAARFAIPGVTANPLIGNYFGIEYYNDDERDDWTINWAEADCGYGVMQITDGMRLAGKQKPGETSLPYDQQRAIALDFAANIAKGQQMLADKWNETRRAGLIVNNGTATGLENWFFAVWAYNSGLHQPSGQNPWGLGWLNNPVNPRYPADRPPFMELSYSDSAHPQHWPYPEKVLGFAGHPIELVESPGTLVYSHLYAWWNSSQDRYNVKPPVIQFCTVSNDCYPGESHTPDDPDVIGEPAGPCAHKNSLGKYDLRCWWHTASTWKAACSVTCGNGRLRFDPGYAYQEDAANYPAVCSLTGLPSGALVVDNLPQDVPSIRPNCTKPASSGTFTFTFKEAPGGTYPGKIDVHQIGAAYGGQLWMSNTHTSPDREAIGTWRLNRTRTGPMKILVHVPDPGARTELAEYRVNADGGGRRRTVNQTGPGGNRWVNLGTFMFTGTTPQVSLSNVTPDGDGSVRIAWDSVAFVPVTGNHHEESVEAVAVFDEDQNIDTAPPASWLGGPVTSRDSLYRWGRDSASAILNAADLGTATRQAITAWKQQVEAAGTDPVNHPDGNSVAKWIGFAQPYTDRPTSEQRPSWFSDVEHFKIRTKATVSFVTEGVGNLAEIIPGTEYVTYEHQTGNSHLPPFTLDLFRAIEQDYGIARPDLSYRMVDLHVHNGGHTSADPARDGRLPGRAYEPGGRAPVLTDLSGAASQDDASCVKVQTTAGGSTGYRPLLSQSGPVEAMDAYVDRLNADSRIPAEVRTLAEDLQDMFFNAGFVAGVDASMFNDAPPIWQELHFLACKDAGVRRVDPFTPVLRSSWMPDQYLYHRGVAIDREGARTGTNAPVLRGDWSMFTQVPETGSNTAYGPCRGIGFDERAGNPWEMNPSIPADPGSNPPFRRFCSQA